MSDTENTLSDEESTCDNYETVLSIVIDEPESCICCSASRKHKIAKFNDNTVAYITQFNGCLSDDEGCDVVESRGQTLVDLEINNKQVKKQLFDKSNAIKSLT